MSLNKNVSMLRLNNIAIAYQDNQVVSDLSLVLETGQIGCLLGPSGCGKSSILRAIAGFEPVYDGEIFLRDKVVSHVKTTLAPEKRHVAVVFQDFALFPHLTVAQNIAFGLHKWEKRKVQERVSEMLELIGLQGVQDRYPHSLSGGQQQRIALARALAPKPDLLLLDEPFSSLDEELREGLAKEIRRILKRENTSALMVTHDQHEAFAIADVIGVMSNGKLHQWADAYSLYHTPVSRFVADFVGNGVFLEAKIGTDNHICTSLGKFPLPDEHDMDDATVLELLVRPDDIVHDDESANWAKVRSRAFKGAHILYELDVEGPGNETVLCLAPSHHDHAVGERFGIRLDLAHLVYFPKG